MIGRFITYAEALRNSFRGDTSPERFFQTFRDGPKFDAPLRLQMSKVFFTSDQHLRQQERADWRNVPTYMRVFAGRFVETARRQGVPLYVHSAYRDQQEQQALYDKGRTKAKWPRAPHCQGQAVDIVHGRYYWELTPNEWALLGKIGKEVAHRMSLPIVWGGDWHFYDPAHWEFEHWRNDIQVFDDAEPLKRFTARGLLAANRGFTRYKKPK